MPVGKAASLLAGCWPGKPAILKVNSIAKVTVAFPLKGDRAMTKSFVIRTGDTVRALAFTDSEGVVHPEISNLTVTDICWVNSSASHCRIDAKGNGFQRVEGVASHFELMH